MNIPAGATHEADVYGQTNYFQKVDSRHLNQVSEEWETLTHWNEWANGPWVDVGKGFSSRRLQKIEPAQKIESIEVGDALESDQRPRMKG